MNKNNQNTITWLTLIFLISRIVYLFLAFLGRQFLAFKESFPYIYKLQEYKYPLLYSWANFDGVHYLGIVRSGYLANFTQVFFPLYPLAVRYVNLFFNNFILSGLIVSNLSFLLFLYFFYKLIKIDYSDEIAKWSILFLVAFPTSFFFASFYTESLFMLFIIVSFYCLRLKKWFLAGVFGFLAALTRVTGVLMFPVILWEVYRYFKNKKPTSLLNQFKLYFISFLPVLGLLLYMYYLYLYFSDPLIFLHSQNNFGTGRTTDKIVLLYQVFFRYLKMMLTVKVNQLAYFSVVLEFLTSLLFLLFLFWGWKKKLNTSYLIFGFLAYIIPTLTGTLTSMPRYVLTIFPAFIVMGMIKNKILKMSLFFVFIILLVINTILFTRGYWVA